MALFHGVGVSAQTSSPCMGGLIQEKTLDGDLVVAGGECVVISSTIEGDVRIVDSDYVVMLNNEIGGKVRIERSDGNEGSGTAHVIANTVKGGNFSVSDHAVANVIDNQTRIGSIRVYRNTEALVQKNVAAYNLVCKDNSQLRTFVNFARETLSCE